MTLTRILVVDGDRAGFLLIEGHLRQHGLAAECHWVGDGDALDAAIAGSDWDLVLSDYGLPDLDFRAVQARLAARLPEVPVILVSGSVGEETAVGLLKGGVADFVLKDRPARLVSAIGHALAEAAQRRARELAEQAQREAEMRLRLALAASRMGVWEWHLGNDELIWSPEVYRLFGVEDRRLRAADFSARVHPNDLEGVWAALRAAIDARHSYAGEFRVVRPDGTMLWVASTGLARYDAAGRATVVVGTITDIGERKRTEAALRASERALEHAQAMARVGNWSADLVAGTYTVGGEAARLFELTPGTHPADDLFALIHPEDRERARSAWLSAATRVGVFEDEHRMRLGERVMWVKVKAEFEYNGGGRAVRAVGVTQDITETREAQHSLEVHRAYLEQLVAARTAELQTARDEAERLSRVKGEFLANMSHEIRTPLNAILGLAQIGARSCSNPDCATSFRRINEAGELLLGVIDDILDFSRIDAERLRIECAPVRLDALLARLRELMGERAAAAGLDLVLRRAPALPASFLGDALRLTQVLVNLIGNAIKFTERGRIELEATGDGENLILRVVDTGIGMDGEQLARIFTAFEQGDPSTTRRFGGSGLGLVISQRLVGLMGGTITCSSRPGAGSRFEIRLPLTAGEELPPPADGDAAAGAVAPGPRLAGLNILAAEDNATNRLVLSEMLDIEGARVTCVENGQILVDRVRSDGAQPWNLVLTDVQMPIMDGYEATRQLRRIAPELPVVGLTAHAMVEERERCREAGMVDHLAKPYNLDELAAVILRNARR